MAMALGRGRWRTWLRVIVSRPLLLGALTGLAILLIGWLTKNATPEGFCVGCWIDAAGGPKEAAAIGAAGASVGSKAIKDLIDKAAKNPITTYKDMWDIASQPTPEGQATKAFEVYKDTIMINHAPPDSVGGQLSAAMDRFLDFATGKRDLDD